MPHAHAHAHAHCSYSITRSGPFCLLRERAVLLLIFLPLGIVFAVVVAVAFLAVIVFAVEPLREETLVPVEIALAVGFVILVGTFVCGGGRLLGVLVVLEGVVDEGRLRLRGEGGGSVFWVLCVLCIIVGVGVGVARIIVVVIVVIITVVVILKVKIIGHVAIIIRNRR